MKSLVFLPFLVVLVFGQQNPQIIKSYYSIEPSGSYSYSYQLSDGTEKSENGDFVKSSDTEDGILRISGFYSYLSPDGNIQFIRYTADERGFLATRPESSISQLTSGSIAPVDVNFNPIAHIPIEIKLRKTDFQPGIENSFLRTYIGHSSSVRFNEDAEIPSITPNKLKIKGL